MKLTFEQEVEETQAQEETAKKVIDGFFGMIANIVSEVVVPLVELEKQRAARNDLRRDVAKLQDEMENFRNK